MHTITTIKHASRGRCIRQFESTPIFEPSDGSVGAPAWNHDETSATTALNRPKNWCSFPVEILRLLMELWLFYKHPRNEKRSRPTIPSPVSPTFVWIQTANFLVGEEAYRNAPSLFCLNNITWNFNLMCHIINVQNSWRGEIILFSLLGNMLDSRHRAIWSVWANVTPYCFSGEQRCASIRGSHAVTCEHLTLNS